MPISYIEAPFTRYLTTVLRSTMCWAQRITARYAKTKV